MNLVHNANSLHDSAGAFITLLTCTYLGVYLITEVLFLSVQVHSNDKEPNTEVTGRITLLLHYVTTYIWFHYMKAHIESHSTGCFEPFYLCDYIIKCHYCSDSFFWLLGCKQIRCYYCRATAVTTEIFF